MNFDPQTYGPAVADLLHHLAPETLGPGEPVTEARPQLAALTPQTLLAGRPLVDPQMAQACCAGLWLRHHFLDESHQISQEIHTPTGSLWHGIMHRREPDFSNAKYWFRQAGNHPTFAALQQQSRQLAAAHAGLLPSADFLKRQTHWEPAAFVDLCELAIRSQSEDTGLCEQIQQTEWELLFDFCYQKALGA